MGSVNQDWQYTICVTNMRLWNSYIEVGQFRSKKILWMELCNIECLPFQMLKVMPEISVDAIRQNNYREAKSQ
jgi:hypothetical protein